MQFREMSAEAFYEAFGAKTGRIMTGFYGDPGPPLVVIHGEFEIARGGSVLVDGMAEDFEQSFPTAAMQLYRKIERGADGNPIGTTPWFQRHGRFGGANSKIISHFGWNHRNPDIRAAAEALRVAWQESLLRSVTDVQGIADHRKPDGTLYGYSDAWERIAG